MDVNCMHAFLCRDSVDSWDSCSAWFLGNTNCTNRTNAFLCQGFGGFVRFVFGLVFREHELHESHECVSVPGIRWIREIRVRVDLCGLFNRRG